MRRHHALLILFSFWPMVRASPTHSINEKWGDHTSLIHDRSWSHNLSLCNFINEKLLTTISVQRNSELSYPHSITRFIFCCMIQLFDPKWGIDFSTQPIASHLPCIFIPPRQSQHLFSFVSQLHCSKAGPPIDSWSSLWVWNGISVKKNTRSLQCD